MAEGATPGGDTALRALTGGVLALVLAALAYAVYIGLANISRIAV